MATMTKTFSFVLIYLKGIVMAMRKEVEGYIELSGDRKKGFTVRGVCVCVCGGKCQFSTIAAHGVNNKPFNLLRVSLPLRQFPCSLHLVIVS